MSFFLRVGVVRVCVCGLVGGGWGGWGGVRGSLRGLLGFDESSTDCWAKKDLSSYRASLKPEGERAPLKSGHRRETRVLGQMRFWVKGGFSKDC